MLRGELELVQFSPLMGVTAAVAVAEELVVEEELAKKRQILDCQQYELHETRLNSTLLKLTI